MNPIQMKVESTCSSPHQVEIATEKSILSEKSTADQSHDSSWALSVFSAFHPGLGALKLIAESLAQAVNVSANPTSLYFGDVNLHSSKNRYFNLNNNGECKARVSFTSPYGFSVSPSSISVSAGGTQSINVTFSPSAAQNYSGYVSGTHSISVYVQGKGVNPYK